MAYSTLEDLRRIDTMQTLQQLTDDDDSGELDQDVVDSAIEAADAEIDGYLRSRYSTIPLPEPIPVLIRNLSSQLAVVELYSRRGQSELPKVVADRAAHSRKTLEKIATGVMGIGVESVSQASGHFKTNKTAADRIYTDDFLEGFKL